MTSARWLHQTPPRFRDARPDMIPDDMRAPWLAHRGNIIVFGATGTGKTFATYALLAEKDPQIKSWMVTTIDGAVEPAAAAAISEAIISVMVTNMTCADRNRTRAGCWSSMMLALTR